MASNFLFDGPEDARITIMLAHGAGAPMDGETLTAAAKALGAVGVRVARFEFGFMRARRAENSRRPAPRAETLIPEYVAAVDDLGPTDGPLIIGGHSMGGRVASMAADALFAAKRIAGLMCLSYPFHPPENPAQLRTKHLIGMQTPALIVEGTRDLFGTPAEVAGYGLPANIEMLWLEDGDHNLKPRKTISGFTTAQHMQTMAAGAAAWTARIAP